MSVVQEARPKTISRSAHLEEPALTRKPGKEINSLGMEHAHALAIAQEATARYREFAVHSADLGNDLVADLFRRLADLEGQHATHLARIAAGKELPKLPPGEYSWLHSDAPLPEARDFIFRMLTPRHALEIAMRAEERARAFFGKMFALSRDAGVRELAIRFGCDEDAHIAWLREALALVPEPFRASDDCPGDPATPQAL
jgi:rubrerythrin